MGYFIANQKERWVFALTVASQAAPTAAEVAAGTTLASATVNDLSVVNGFTAKSAFATVQGMAGGFKPKLAGSQEAEDSSLVFNEQDTYAGNTIKAALAQGTNGFMIVSRYLRGTLVAGTKVDVFPVTVGGNNRIHTADDSPAQYQVDFSITNQPSIDATVAA